MFVIIYHKTTKKIAQYRHDVANPISHTAQEYFNMFLYDNEVGNENYTFIEVPFTKLLNAIEIGNHVYNEATGQVEADPNYVRLTFAATPVLTAPTEPTA